MKFSHFLLLILIVLLENLQAQYTTIVRGSSRMKRQACQDGYGWYEGRKCCKCPPGFHVTKCNQNETECLDCERESYRDHANLLASCEPCTSCNPTANLETEEKCTVRQNTVCRCKEGYYCEEAVSEECKACHSCKKCEDGFAIEKECTPTSDTVCKKVEGGGPWWTLIVLPIIIFAIVIVIVYVFKKRKLFCFADKPKDDEDPDKDNNINERIPLKHIDLIPHLNDIVKELGPRSTTELVRGDLKDTVIQFHEADAPNDSQERCYRILKEWCEQQGLENAAPNLIQKLNDKGMNTTADKIKNIILPEKKK